MALCRSLGMRTPGPIQKTSGQRDSRLCSMAPLEGPHAGNSRRRVMLDLEQLREAMRRHGAKQLLLKELAANDNSKNQPYLGSNLELLNILPIGEVAEETSKSGKSRLKAPLPLSWLREDGTLTPAQNTQ